MKRKDTIFENKSHFQLEVTQDGRYFADWNGGVWEFKGIQECIDYLLGHIQTVKPNITIVTSKKETQ